MYVALKNIKSYCTFYKTNKLMPMTHVTVRALHWKGFPFSLYLRQCLRICKNIIPILLEIGQFENDIKILFLSNFYVKDNARLNRIFEF